MKICVDSTEQITNYCLYNLRDEKINFTLSEEFEIPDGWYNFVVEYSGETVDITDIKINECSIGHLIYTGFFTESATGKRSQPANAVWTDGYYSIWLHTQIGFMTQILVESIRNGDYGKNLFEKYLLTIDKSIKMDSEWPFSIRAYYDYANGPRWWRKDTLKVPYEECEPTLLADIDKEKLMAELPMDCNITIEYDILGKGETVGKMYGIVNKKSTAYPFVEVDSLKSEELKKLCRRLGYVKILKVSLQTLPPGVAFQVHIDDHYNRDSQEFIEGPVVFVWNLAEKQDNHFFKLGAGGLAPMKYGAFFNQFYFSHGTFNDSEVERPLLTIHGDRGKKFDHA